MEKNKLNVAIEMLTEVRKNGYVGVDGYYHLTCTDGDSKTYCYTLTLCKIKLLFDKSEYIIFPNDGDDILDFCEVLGKVIEVTNVVRATLNEK